MLTCVNAEFSPRPRASFLRAGAAPSRVVSMGPHIPPVLRFPFVIRAGAVGALTMSDGTKNDVYGLSLSKPCSGTQNSLRDDLIVT